MSNLICVELHFLTDITWFVVSVSPSLCDLWLVPHAYMVVNEAECTSRIGARRIGCDCDEVVLLYTPWQWGALSCGYCSGIALTALCAFWCYVCRYRGGMIALYPGLSMFSTYMYSRKMWKNIVTYLNAVCNDVYYFTIVQVRWILVEGWNKDLMTSISGAIEGA